VTTIHTRQLQQYTRPTNNNYTQDNLKLATIHTRQHFSLFHAISSTDNKRSPMAYPLHETVSYPFCTQNLYCRQHCFMK